MCLKQKLIFIIQSVLFVTLVGCSSANDRSTSIISVVDTVANVDSVDKSFYQYHKGSAQSEEPSEVDQLQSLKKQCDQLQRNSKRDHRLIVFLFVLFCAAVGIFVHLNKKQSEQQKKRDGVQDGNLQQLYDDVSRVVQELRDLRREVQTRPQVSQVSYAPFAKKEDDRVKEEKRPKDSSSQTFHGGGAKTPSKIENKYFMLQELNGQLLVRDRNLKTDPIGWFVMEIQGERATYDINPKMIPSILADLSTMRLCANDFESKPNASSIRTVKKGVLRKEGQSWVVTEKITITLV